jgi:hypothetical protein
MESVIQKAMAKDKKDRFDTAAEMTDALRAIAHGEPTRLQAKAAAPTLKASPQAAPEKTGPRPPVVIAAIGMVVLIALASVYLALQGMARPAPTEAPVMIPTFTATFAPTATETAAPAEDSTEIPVVLVEPTITETPAPTDTAAPSAPVLGGAQKIAFVANNEIWVMNVDGTELNMVTTDGGAKND